MSCCPGLGLPTAINYPAPPDLRPLSKSQEPNQRVRKGRLPSNEKAGQVLSKASAGLPIPIPRCRSRAFSLIGPHSGATPHRGPGVLRNSESNRHGLVVPRSSRPLEAIDDVM